MTSTIEPTTQGAPSPKTSPPSTKGSFRRAIIRRVKIFTVLFVLYVLSIGPMFWTWYESKYLNANPWVALFYEPLLFLTAIPFINAYINWWIL